MEQWIPLLLKENLSCNVLNKNIRSHLKDEPKNPKWNRFPLSSINQHLCIHVWGKTFFLIFCYTVIYGITLFNYNTFMILLLYYNYSKPNSLLRNYWSSFSTSSVRLLIADYFFLSHSTYYNFLFTSLKCMALMNIMSHQTFCD